MRLRQMTNSKVLCKQILIVALSICVFISIGINVYAKNKEYAFSDSFQRERLYIGTNVNDLNADFSRDVDSFKKNDGKYFALTGSIRTDSVTDKGKKIRIYGDTGNAYVECNTDKESSKNLRAGMKVTIYGQLNVSGFGKNVSFSVDADKVNASAIDFQTGCYIYDDGTVMPAVSPFSSSKDKNITYYIPTTWNTEHVMAKLTNNGIDGQQFYLNVLSEDAKNAEIFNVFYFSYDEYTRNHPKKMKDSDAQSVEAEIVKNILTGDTDKIKVREIESKAGNTVDYYSTSYTWNDKDYNLEFIFKRDQDSNGLLCMLYMYYPDGNSNKHVKEVSYLVDSIQTKSSGK